MLVMAGWVTNTAILMDFWPTLVSPEAQAEMAKGDSAKNSVANPVANQVANPVATADGEPVSPAAAPKTVSLQEVEKVVTVGRINSAAAVTMFLLSIALLLITAFNRNRITTIIGQVICVLMFGATAFAAYVAISGELFDEIKILPGPDPAAMGVTFPTPMTVEVAVVLALVSLAIAALPFQRIRSVTVSQGLSLVALVIPLLILLGASTQITQLCNFKGCVTLSAGCSLLEVILISAVFFSFPGLGLAASLSGVSTGHAMMRRVSLFLCLLPALLMARTMLVSPPLELGYGASWVIFVFVIVIALACIIGSAVTVLNRVETELTGKIDYMRDELERTATTVPPVGQLEMSGVANFKPKYKRVCLTCTSEYDDSTDRCPVDFSPLSRVLDESLIGTVFMDKYDIMERLGAGGMSTVYRAKHRFFEKDVAIKVLKGNTLESKDGLKRFQREARATSAISHVGIVGVSDFGLTPDGRAYLVMDYLEGESLSHFLDRVGRLSVSDMVDIASQLCDALTVAHESGIVHRDLKPSNIMLVKDENHRTVAKIVDFGLAKILEEDNSASLKITQTGECFGSPLYMSPEQCMGKKIDHRCDIYALGCILFECLVGTPPIIGVNAADTITKHVKDRPAPFPEGLPIPKEIKLIIYKALHKEAMWRPQSVMEIKDALAGSLRHL